MAKSQVDCTGIYFRLLPIRFASMFFTNAAECNVQIVHFRLT
jgi:hypothetical protein